MLQLHSMLRLARIIPMDFVCACPEGYAPDTETVEWARSSGLSTITVCHDAYEAVKVTITPTLDTFLSSLHFWSKF